MYAYTYIYITCDSAQAKFNALPRALRHLDEGKAELHMLVEDVQEALWAISDTKRAAAEAMLTALATDGWLAQHALRLVLALLDLSAAGNAY